MVLRTALLTAGYLEDVYLIRLYPRHFYQITRELFSTDLSDEAYHSIHIPFLLANIFSKQSVVYLITVVYIHVIVFFVALEKPPDQCQISTNSQATFQP